MGSRRSRNQSFQFYPDLASGPFYGFNRPGAKVLEAVVPELVPPGNEGEREGALRWDRRVLTD